MERRRAHLPRHRPCVQIAIWLLAPSRRLKVATQHLFGLLCNLVRPLPHLTRRPVTGGRDV